MTQTGEPSAARDREQTRSAPVYGVVPLLAEEALQLLRQLVARGERAERRGLVAGARLELVHELLKARLGRDRARDLALEGVRGLLQLPGVHAHAAHQLEGPHQGEASPSCW